MKYFYSFTRATTLLITFLIINYAYADTHVSSNYSKNLIKAHQQYDKGEYSKAIAAYKLAKASQIEDGRIHYNLGNFYFRNSEIGKSIFHYNKAQQLLPRDEDILFNLQYARDKILDKIEDKSSWFSAISLSKIFNYAESLYFISFLFFTFWSVSILLIFIKNEWLKWIRRTLLIITILSGFVVLKDLLSTDQVAVITADEAKVYSAIGKDNVVLFTLHNGTEFTISRHLENQWLQITLKDGKKGWIKATDAIFDAS